MARDLCSSKRWKLGRTRIQVVPDVKARTLLDFVEDTCEQGSTIYADGLSAYQNLPSRGVTHNANAVSKGSDLARVVLPAVHRVASLVKRWLLGTHHGGIGAQHVEAYLDEFHLPLQPAAVERARPALLSAALERRRRQEARLRHNRLVAARTGRRAPRPDTEAASEASTEGTERCGDAVRGAEQSSQGTGAGHRSD
jgi:transposase-like protein